MRLLACRDAGWHDESGIPPAQARELALGPVPVWVRADGVVHGEEWSQIGEWFDLHPLALEDMRNPRQRPKVEDYPGFTFTVLRVPRLVDGDVAWTQVGVFLGAGFVMTASADRLPELDDVEKRILAGDWRGRGGELDMLFYFLLDAIMDTWFPYMDGLEDRLEEVEDAVLDRADKQRLRQIRDIKSLASRTRKVLSPTREAVLSLERMEHPNIRSETRIYLRDVADHTIRLAERLEHVREVALIAQETWNSTLANQQNETMKRLTIVAALLLFPTLVAGIGGMNFEADFPDWNFWVVTMGLLAFIVIGAGVARWRGWL
jgi:magnesium transporter